MCIRDRVKAAKQISREEARETAAKAASVKTSSLKDDSDEEGKMPSYCFTADNMSIAITKQGGYLSYLVNSREVSDRNVSEDQCKEAAERFLTQNGYQSLKQTYYEIKGGLMTINYAGTQGEVVLYLSLIHI